MTVLRSNSPRFFLEGPERFVFCDPTKRMAHILHHQEMAGMKTEVEHTVQTPAEMRISRSDSTVQLFYEYYAHTRVGGKWLCVVVKYHPDDAFVVTAYLTDQLKARATIWPKK